MNKSIFSGAHKIVVRKLCNARKANNFSQSRVASNLGTTQSYLSKIEAGQRRVDVILLKKLAQIYKKPIDYFLK